MNKQNVLLLDRKFGDFGWGCIGDGDGVAHSIVGGVINTLLTERILDLIFLYTIRNKN